MDSAKENDMTHSRTAGAVIVAHPDDEILWAGGAILARGNWDWFVVTLCRANDPDRSPRFARILQILRANGQMADLDDGSEQTPLPADLVQQTILASLPRQRFHLILTHGPAGEYTRHRRHEEVCRAVVALWQARKLTADGLWMFAYEDAGRQHLPRVRRDADVREELPESLWQEKTRLITQIYGFPPDSWEVRAVPREEGFRCFEDAQSAHLYIEESESPT